jgi:hypothetical protein
MEYSSCAVFLMLDGVWAEPLGQLEVASDYRRKDAGVPHLGRCKVHDLHGQSCGLPTLHTFEPSSERSNRAGFSFTASFSEGIINGGAIIDHEAPRERRFVAVEK